MEVSYTISDNNIHINNSYQYKTIDEMSQALDIIKCDHHNCKVFNRSRSSLLNEWAAHNLLYNLHIFRSHTAEVDLEYPQKWIFKVVYLTLSQWYEIFCL